MNGRASPSSPGRTCARPPEAGVSPRTSPTCRRGSSRRSAVRPRIGPAPRCASTSMSSRTRATYGDIPGANLLDWPITLAEMEPWYAKAEDKMGVTRTNGIPGLPGNNNFKVMEAGAKKLGYKEVHTGNMAINSEARDGRGACQQIGFCFQGCKSGAKWSTLYTEIPQGRGDRQSRGAPQQHGDQDRARRVRQGDGRGLCRPERRAAAPEGARRGGRRQLDREPAAVAQQRLDHVPGRACQFVRAGRPQLHAPHDRQRVRARSRSRCTCIAAPPWPASSATRRSNDPKRGFVGGYEMETLSIGVPFMAAFLNPGAWGRSFTSAMESLSADGRHVAGRRGHAAGDQPHHARSDKPRTSSACRWRTCISTITQRRRDAQPRLQAGRRRLRGRRRHRDLSRRRPIRARIISAPTG